MVHLSVCSFELSNEIEYRRGSSEVVGVMINSEILTEGSTSHTVIKVAVTGTVGISWML